MTAKIDDLAAIYNDARTCAELVGLHYVDDETEGIVRRRHGKGFSYAHKGSAIRDKKFKKRIAELAVPPAWQEVWICPDLGGHILATGIDERGRKQYIYHPKWRTVRDLIKFYRMIVFARCLPKIRRETASNLKKRSLSLEKVVAAMIWILDNTYIRIGNDTYFEQNDSVGLTTLTAKNIVVAGPVTTLSFKGKSGKDQQITFENPTIAKLLHQLRQVRGARLFRYQDAAGDRHDISSEDINRYLHELTGEQISAKDFRTWGGTLMAYHHLVSLHEAHEDTKPEKAVIEAVDAAADVLGNTRAVARASYVHPHLLEAYGTKDFERRREQAQTARRMAGLEPHESELLHFIESLFEDEFEPLAAKTPP